jgi:hypothetical protein
MTLHHTPYGSQEAIAEIALPELQKPFYPLERSPDLVCRDSV